VLPQAARLDGAGHFAQYWHIVLPLSKQIIAVVVIVNILGTWNNFLWPQIANTDQSFAVVSTGLYLMSRTQNEAGGDASTLFAAYVISAIPLLIRSTANATSASRASPVDRSRPSSASIEMPCTIAHT